MDFDINYLSFFVIDIDNQEDHSKKTYKQLATLDSNTYNLSELKPFLDGELLRITKRKVDRHPKSEQVPTKIGYFIVELGFQLESNPNYNLFNRIRVAQNLNEFSEASSELVRAYTDTASVRGGVLITVAAKLNKYFDEPFFFILKCDFEQKVASITDEKTLINNVQMAITTKNMKSIQYPYMPEDGMVEKGELKIHQSSHARYFEDFLRYIDYEKSMPEIIRHQVVTMVHQEIQENYAEESEEREQVEASLASWATSPKRELQERWTPDQVVEASSSLIEQSPELELKLKLDHISIKGLLSDFGDNIHIAKVNERYVVLIEGDMFQFEKNISPVEFLKPGDLKDILDKLKT
jgi:hypothetical protein